jgi:hypothetical protein
VSRVYIIFNQSISSERLGRPQLDPAGVRLYGGVFLFLTGVSSRPDFEGR